MARTSTPRFSAFLLVAVVFLILGLDGGSLGAQDALEVSEASLCFPRDAYPHVEVAVPADVEIAVARICFQSERESAPLWTTMELMDGKLRATLPVPRSSTQQVPYFITAVTAEGEGLLSAVEFPRLADAADCDPDGVFDYLSLDEDPKIVLANRWGASLPLDGFTDDGVAGIVGSQESVCSEQPLRAAPATTESRKLPSAVVAGIIVGGALGAVVVVDKLDDDDEGPASPSQP